MNEIAAPMIVALVVVMGLCVPKRLFSRRVLLWVSVAMVAAGAVVREQFVVPEGVLVAGVPAKIVRHLTESERVMLRQSADNYVHYARGYMLP